jgi:uncharacterized membrane protein
MNIHIVKFRWTAPLAIVALVLLVSSFSSIFAQTQTDSVQLAISPQVLEIQVNPGDSVKNQFRLTNGSDIPLTIQVTPKNFTPSGEEGAIDITTDDTTYSLAKWVSVEPSRVVIEPKTTKDFMVTIDVPSNAEPGARFGTIVFATVPQQQEGSGAAVSQEIAPVVLVKVAGDVVESANIEQFYSVENIWSNQPNITLEARVKNNGNVFIKPRGNVVIKNMFGDTVQTLPISERNVLPDSIRKLDAVWQNYNLSIGKYTATVTMVYGQDDQVLTAETTFYYFPYQIILPIIAVLAILGWLIFRYRSRIKAALKVLSGKSETPS